MKRKLLRISFFIFFFLTTHAAKAQKSFVEGELSYAITIVQNNPDQKTQNITDGILYIKQKGNAVLKELFLKNGFKNTKLFLGKGKPSYSFIVIGEKNFALQGDKEQTNKTLSRCSTMTTEPFPTEVKATANFKTERAKILCNDRTPISVYYTQEWQINNPFLFEEFPTFQYLPLSFDINNDDGSLIHFELLSIEAKPMDNATFEIPKGYKMITQEEYKSWQH